MPFIGNQPALSYTSFAKQDFTTSATTSYTLDHSVTNENEIALFINFVRQEPTTAYTASGTTLTLTSATSSSDDMYCVYLGKAVQTVNPPNSSVGNSQLDVSAINSQTAETSIAGGDEVLIYDTSASALRKMTRTNFVSGIGGTNTPAFSVKKSSNQTVADTTSTKMELDSEFFDTDNKYDNSTNYRFTPGVAGKYFLYATTAFQNFTQNRIVSVSISKNGSSIASFNNITGSYSDDFSAIVTTIAEANTTDYFEAFCFHRGGSSQTMIGSASTFGGYKIIE